MRNSLVNTYIGLENSMNQDVYFRRQVLLFSRADSLAWHIPIDYTVQHNLYFSLLQSVRIFRLFLL